MIIDAVRSPIGRGKAEGALADVRPDELAAEVVRGLVDRTGIDPNQIEDLVLGCSTQVAEQGADVARTVALLAGLPVEVAGATVNRFCGSSMQALMQASHAIIAGTIDVAIAGGVESMSRVPIWSDYHDTEWPSELLERFDLIHQGLAAELIAEKWSFTRADLDACSLRSHERAVRAIDEGKFEREIIPLQRTNGTTPVAIDEGPRRDTSLEKLADLKPAFKADGLVTAGNASQISDGASAVLVTGSDTATQLGLMPRGRVVSFGLVGVDPIIMLHGNPLAIRKALEKASLTLDDIAVIEINEAFASVVLQAVHDLRIEDRWGDINPNGSGISLGHPLGATGTRIVATLLSELERRQARFGLGSMCIGNGMAICGIVENLSATG
jgi:acetyl-CoA acyltransferase